MGKRGDGYGSEDHLRRCLAPDPRQLNARIAAAIGVGASSIGWLDFPISAGGAEREFRGLEFLRGTANEHVVEEWAKFWPTTGRQQTWDAVGRAGDAWLLVEAKANWPEFCSGPTTAKTSGGLPQITKSLNHVKRDLGVHRYFAWTGTYYQYANRLATLWFVRRHGVPAYLVFVYFTGDVFPDGTPCPTSEKEWEDLIQARRLTLGLPTHHALSDYEHHVTLPACRDR